MGHPFPLFFALTASLCSFGHLTRELDSPVRADLVESVSTILLSGVKNEADLYVEGMVESSGHSPGSATSSKPSVMTTSLKEAEIEDRRSLFRSKVMLASSPAERAEAAITGVTDTSGNSEEAAGRHLKDIHSSTIKDDSVNEEGSFKFPFQPDVFTFMKNFSLSGHGGPCVFGVQPCTIFDHFNGSSLLWDDMRRTLAFAWELHVFGSASFFTLMALMAVSGLVGACSLPQKLRRTLSISNCFLLVGGAVRAALLLIDPYGTRQILPHWMLAALHNAPLLLLLWAQVLLALVTLNRSKLLLFPSRLQRPVIVGLLGIFHSTVLLLADLYSSTLSPAFPLLLQTVSLCWGVPFCLGILVKSLSNLRPFSRSSLPQWVPSRRTERLRTRVMAVCALLGLLCCSLQMYSILWLYGLLGNWRRFGWGWWLSQFWARILELSWGFSILFLGSWIFWSVPKRHVRRNHQQGKKDVSKRVERKSFWHKVLGSMQKGPLKKSEKSWADLMPNNWAKYNQSRAGRQTTCDDEPATKTTECSPDPISRISSDSQTALLWQKVGERECVLSLIEFEMPPPSPINLRRSIDDALHHGPFAAGGVFTPPPPSWIHALSTNGTSLPSAFPPSYVSYGWMLDTESITASLDHFQTRETAPSISATPDYTSTAGSPTLAQKDFSAGLNQHDWSDDDVTNL